MELFSVNRYVGDKPGNGVTNEDEILQNLLKNVEKRKRKQKSDHITDTGITEEKQVRKVSVELAIESRENNDIDPIYEGIENQTNDVEKQNEDAESTGGFAVLGEEKHMTKSQSVPMVLTPWLAHPTIISTSVAASNIEEERDIGQLSYLAPHIRGALKEMNITKLFPVQLAVVPWVLTSHSKPAPFQPRDICVSAPTGSGKTLAFAIPVVQLLSQRVERKIRALVILPVAELAHQVFKVFKKLCEKTDLTVCLLSTKVTFQLEQEKLVEQYKGKYYSKVDIVVTTPGRLVDHLHATNGFCLRELKFLIIDEADRIMDAVFQNWLYHLDAHVRTTSNQLLSGRAAPLCYNELESLHDCQPHKLLFSATLSQDPEKLKNLRLFQPKLFTSVVNSLQKLRQKLADTQVETDTKARGEFIGKYTTPAELTEKFCITEGRLKPLTLFSLIKGYEWKKFLCFTNSVESSGRLAFVLKQLFQDEVKIEELSASINIKERSQILNSFERGLINGLVCSDALARGIDIPDIDIVISYDPPRHVKTYIHRIGRTARAGRTGTAITLLTQKEQETFEKTLAEAGKVITSELTAFNDVEESYAQEYSSALMALRTKVTKDKHLTLIQKERAKEKALLHKDTSEMTLMEKLQVQASTKIHERVEETTPILSSRKNRSKKFKTKTQKNASK